jgi:hypothetical protein
VATVEHPVWCDQLRHRFTLDRRRLARLRITLGRALARRSPAPVCVDLGSESRIQTFPLARPQAAALHCALGWALVMLSPEQPRQRQGFMPAERAAQMR